eukprot:scaffold16988_cov21-Tisochrysis_lutea.AAC.1
MLLSAQHMLRRCRLYNCKSIAFHAVLDLRALKQKSCGYPSMGKENDAAHAELCHATRHGSMVPPGMDQ